MKKANLFLVALIAAFFMVSCGGKSTSEGTAEGNTTEEVKATTETADAGTASTASALVDGQYAVSEGSAIAWVGKKVTGQHNGTIGISEGAITVAGGKITGGNVKIDMTSIVCEDLEDEKYNQKLIGHLASDDFFSTEKFPTAELNIKEVSGEGENLTLKGDLTIKGITQSVEIPATIKSAEGSLSANATFTIDRTLWEVKYNSGKFFQDLGDKMIDDNIELSFDLTADKANS